METIIMGFMVVSCVSLISWLIFTECIYEYIAINYTQKQKEIIIYLFYAIIGISIVAYTIYSYYKRDSKELVGFVLIITFISFIITFFSHFLFDIESKDWIIINLIHILIPFAYLSIYADISGEIALISGVSTGLVFIFFGIRQNLN
ncbi:hypothetical protein P5G62_010485 [Neobacillus sp. 179-C4.2 HS]|uniref:Uncharacterized protein n=1 Tax=Neobacillus driksii TaxID=3035913 RepID=A0ABV4YRQ5_9BACI|nr:hypothetical protein [Neobacillus sp. 179.-C4.2 HS]MDP5195109.1 hypothetical protein [Neobacillus sp. 179.-C4.2 HS]